MDVRVGLWRKLNAEELMLLNCGVGEDSWESLGLHPKGDQSCEFIGRTDVEAENPILWPPDVKSWLIGKDPDAGKDWRWDEKRTTEDEWLDGITDSVDMSLCNSRSWRWTWRPGVLRFMGSQTVRHDWATELNWTNMWKWTVQQYTHADKVTDFISKGAWAESSSVREPRTALPRGPQSRVLWGWD